MDWMLLLLIAASHLASAFLAATIARQKARNSRMWFVAGLLFGLLGLIAAVLRFGLTPMPSWRRR